MAGHEVFISYSSLDKPTADAICHGLEADGLRCWIAPRDVLPGMEWQQSLLDAIASAQVVVLVFTANSNDSVHVRKEITAAAEASRIVIPFRLDPVEPKGSLRWDLTGVHWLDALNPPLEQRIGELATSVRRIIGREQGAAPPPVEPTPEPVPPPPPPIQPPPTPAAKPLGLLQNPAPQGFVEGVARKPLPWLILGGSGLAVLLLVIGLIWLSASGGGSDANQVVAQNNGRSTGTTVVTGASTGTTPTSTGRAVAPPPQQPLTPGQQAAVGLLRASTTQVQEYANEFQQIPNGPPTQITGGGIVSTVALATTLSQHLNEVVLIDALGCGEHLSIPTARCVALSQDTPGLLRANNIAAGTPLVVFCDGPGCPNSYVVAQALTAAGYANVFWYRGGLEAWNAAGGPTDTPTPLDPNAPPVPVSAPAAEAPAA